MAKIKAGILSKVSGKVAGVVGGTWKGTNYIRELVKPSNPNTALQQTQRGKMSFVVRCARQLVGDILSPYLNKFCKTMSGYNWFCKENIVKLDGTPLAFTSAPVLSFGTLASGAFDTDNTTFMSDIELASVPQVAAGHTLKFIAAAISENGEVLLTYAKENPAVGEQIVGSGSPASGSYTGWTVGFFADFDANGVLQQISASIATAKGTEVVD